MKKLAITIILLVGGFIVTSYKIKTTISREVLTVLGINDPDIVTKYLYCNNNPNCFITAPNMSNLSVLKALSTSDKLSLANEAFVYAKKYCSSQEFKDLYEQKRQELKPRVPEITPEAKEQALAMVKEQEEMYTPEILAMLPPDAKAEALKALDDMKSHANGEMTADQKKEWEEIAPKDPNTSVKRMLKSFLDETKDVDFNATTKLNPENKHQVFNNSTYEKKSDQWKACYRAGKELTGAARTFATEWLDELN